jgi:hypothetical protein
MPGTATKLHVLDCGSMSCDLTWLLLKPGRSIRPRAERDKPVEWYPCTTHAVVVETPEGTMLMGHLLPARLGDALGADRAAGVLPL